MMRDSEYVLGTNDEEVMRLGIQHRAWRPNVLSAWRRAGFAPGKTVMDIGCGPGYATLDLAEIVGPTGRVVAVDKSRRFLDVLDARTRQRGIENVSIYELDLDLVELPDITADGAWCRWVLTFVERPREVLERVCRALKPGGVIVIHEYFDYSTWRTAPRCAEVEEFVSAVVASWKATGGEPDVGLVLPHWLRDLGLEIVATPIIDIVPPTDQMWLWLRTFIQSGRHRLVETGYLSSARAEAIWNAFVEREGTPGTLMITPGVMELRAMRR